MPSQKGMCRYCLLYTSGLGNPGQLLIDDPARADVGVALSLIHILLTEERYWGLNGVEAKSLSNGVSAYDISVMW